MDFVQFLACFLDQRLVGSLGDDEHKRVVVLDVLDGGLTAEGVLDHGELVEGVLFLHGPQDVLGVPLLRGGLGQLERHLGPDLSLTGGLGSLLNSGGSLLSSGGSDLAWLK